MVTMPIYEYECLNCKKKFEVLQKISSEPLQTCIYCQGLVKKLISASSFHFKGSGWYITDYKKNQTDDKDVKKETPIKSEKEKVDRKDVTQK